MEIQKEEIEKFLETVKKYQTIRVGASDFRNESAKDPELDKKSFGNGFEHGIYYAVSVLFGTEFVDNMEPTKMPNKGSLSFKLLASDVRTRP